MQDILNYIHETYHVSRVFSVAVVFYLQFVLHVILCRTWNMFCTFTLALPAVCVRCQIWLFFFCSLISCFPGMLLRYYLGDFEMVPVAPIIDGITLAFTFHMRWISIMRSLHFKVISASFLITFLSPGIATPINMHVPFLLLCMKMAGLLLGTVLSVHTCWYHHMVTLPSRFVSTDFGRWSYHCSFSNFIPTSLHMLKCSWAHTPSCLFMYCSFANNGHAEMTCSTVLTNCLHSRHLLYVSVRNIFVVCYLVCNDWSCAAIISPSVPPFISPLDCHTNVSSSSTSCLSILLVYWSCITLLSLSFFKDSPNFAFMCWMPSFFCATVLIWLI